jgi:2-aminoadipate transaminase
MADAKPFSYEGSFAKGTPAARPRGAVRRGKYDFAVAYPDPASVPLDGLLESLKGALDEEGGDLAVYPHQQGYPPLREYIAQKLAKDRDIHVTADDIVLADGSSQPIHMICEALLDPGDVVLTEDFVYSGTLGTLRRFQADIRGVPCDDQGMEPDALESAINKAVSEGRRPKFMYLIPTFQNPQGWETPAERRQAIVRLSQRYDVPILEDDCYVDLRYEGEPVTSMHALDDTGRVMYVASFSKIIAPGMRQGYLTAAPEVLDRVLTIKSGGGANQFTALAIHRFSTQLDDHIDEINDIQRVKRDAMVAALGENFGSEATWSNPPGALFIWLQMGEDADLVSIRGDVLDKYDVGYNPGPLFAPDATAGRNRARLCFGYNTPEEIREGVARLAEAFEQEGVLKA